MARRRGATGRSYAAPCTSSQLDSLSTTISGNTTLVRYTYDGLGRRITRDGPGGFEAYLYDGDRVIVVMDDNQTVLRSFSYYPGVDKPHSVMTDTAIYYYATDPTGSVRPENLSGRDKQVVDFVYGNALTDNLLLVEIKKPQTELLASTPYRGSRIYTPSRELVGAVSQILAYRHSIKQFIAPALEGQEKLALRSDPLCAVIVGDQTRLVDAAAKESFEQYRRELRNVEILTFDELEHRAHGMLELLDYHVDSDFDSNA